MLGAPRLPPDLAHSVVWSCSEVIVCAGLVSPWPGAVTTRAWLIKYAQLASLAIARIHATVHSVLLIIQAIQQHRSSVPFVEAARQQRAPPVHDDHT
jgi:hypothetical protein